MLSTNHNTICTFFFFEKFISNNIKELDVPEPTTDVRKKQLALFPLHAKNHRGLLPYIITHSFNRTSDSLRLHEAGSVGLIGLDP